jgi:hypothetical protein
VKADLARVKAPQTFVNLPDSPSLPLPFAVGDYPELRELVTAPLALPATINCWPPKPPRWTNTR